MLWLPGIHSMQPFAAELSVNASHAVTILWDSSMGAVLSTCQLIARSHSVGFTKISAFLISMFGPRILWTEAMMLG